MPENIDNLFQEYLSLHAHEARVDFRPLLERYPEHSSFLEKKIKAHDLALKLMREDDNRDSGPDPLIGKTIRGCKITSLIARGGMSMVYLARQEALARDVAVKVINTPFINSDASLGRFRRESQNIAKLEHENILPVYDVGEEAGFHFVITKYVRGVPLDKVIDLYRKSSKFPDLADIDRELFQQNSNDKKSIAKKFDGYMSFVLHVIRQTAVALQFAHEHGIIHRDIKPSNILIRPDGEPVLIDFGLSRDFNEKGITLTGEYMGTPAYSSPEQLFGKQEEISPKSDVYSLGVVFYELVAGRLPFEGETFAEIIKKIGTEQPQPLSDFSLDLEVGSVVMGMMAKNIIQRPNSADIFKAYSAFDKAPSHQRNSQFHRKRTQPQASLKNILSKKITPSLDFFENWKNWHPILKFVTLIWVTFLGMISFMGGLNELKESWWGILWIGVGLLLIIPYWGEILKNIYRLLNPRIKPAMSVPPIWEESQVIDWFLINDHEIADLRQFSPELLQAVKNEIIHDLHTHNNAQSLKSFLEGMANFWGDTLLPQALLRKKNQGPLHGESEEDAVRMVFMERCVAAKVRVLGYFLLKKFGVQQKFTQ